MANQTWRRAVPLALAALLVLGGCDDDEEKNPEVEVHVPKGVDLKVKRAGDDDNEMIVIGELALFTTFVVWALFGPGATARREMRVSENR